MKRLDPHAVFPTTQEATVPHPDPEAARLEILKRFTYHPPKEDQPEKYNRLRGSGLELALLIAELVPESREQSLALTHLEQAIAFGNAGIARRS